MRCYMNIPKPNQASFEGFVLSILEQEIYRSRYKVLKVHHNGMVWDFQVSFQDKSFNRFD